MGDDIGIVLTRATGEEYPESLKPIFESLCHWEHLRNARGLRNDCGSRGNGYQLRGITYDRVRSIFRSNFTLISLRCMGRRNSEWSAIDRNNIHSWRWGWLIWINEFLAKSRSAHELMTRLCLRISKHYSGYSTRHHLKSVIILSCSCLYILLNS